MYGRERVDMVGPCRDKKKLVLEVLEKYRIYDLRYHKYHQYRPHRPKSSL